MGDESKSEWSWRKECPKFCGKQSEYKSWKGLVEDWLVVCGDIIQYPGLEIRLSLKGKALEVTEEIERAVLKGEDGAKKILNKLDSVYLKDTLMDNYGKMKKYFKIERDSSEKMRDFIIRYETAASECSKAIGKQLFEGEAKGFHVMEQANLTENQKQMVLAACGQGTLDYSSVSKIMKRIFEGLGTKEEDDWWGFETPQTLGRGREGYRNRGRPRWIRGRGGRNPVNREGKVMLCVLCRSEWHWGRDCPQNPQNKEKLYENNSGNAGGKHNFSQGKDRTTVEEKIYVGEIQEADMNSWGEVDAILDTGCKSTVCGEL